MNKIIPIISIIVSALCLTCSIIATILMSVAISARGLELIGIPTTIIAFVISLLSGAFNVIFFKSILCKIAFFINVTAFLLSAASIIIWLAVL
ncbi:MAG: hypothetical protein J1F39_03530 [Clostridiales bacterium]|nr:hypothetical protein [Clostridiales bacterium]